MDSFDLPDRQRITQIVASLHEFIDGGARGRRVLLEQAGLDRFLTAIILTESARTVAGDLIGRLEKYGELHPGLHALGALLNYLLTLQGDLSEEDRRYLAQMIVKYNLVADPTYQHQLRDQYDIPESTAPSTTSPLAPTITPLPEPDVIYTPPEEIWPEAVLGQKDDNFLDISFLNGAVYSSRAVCRLEKREGPAKGTGFLVGPDLVLTNHHVLSMQADLVDAVAHFGYQCDDRGIPQSGQIVRLRTDFYHSSPQELLDYALVRLQACPLSQSVHDDTSHNPSWADHLRNETHQGYLTLVPRMIKNQDRVNIIQHPYAGPMKVVMTQNYVVGDMMEKRVYYRADTEWGSSGAPVFNQNWEVVALHHAGKPHHDSWTQTLGRAWKGQLRVNQGIPMRAILKDFKDKGLLRYLPDPKNA